PIHSLSRLRISSRSRCSWWASAVLLAAIQRVPPVSLTAAVSAATCGPTASGQSHRACASRVRRAIPSALSAPGRAALRLRTDRPLLDPKDGGMLEHARRQVLQVGGGDQRLRPRLEGGEQALPPSRVQLRHDVVEEEDRLFAGGLRKVVELGQLQAEDYAPLLPLTGELSRVPFFQQHLQIVALRSDSCLSPGD